MFANKLEATYWNHLGHEAEEVLNPSWDEVVTRLQRLDGVAHDGLMIDGPAGAYMGIFGGQSNGYVVAGIDKDGQHFILADSVDRGGWHILCVGGQDTPYADFEIIQIEKVLQVARTFFETGKCDARFKWNLKAAGRSPGARNKADHQ